MKELSQPRDGTIWAHTHTHKTELDENKSISSWNLEVKISLANLWRVLGNLLLLNTEKVKESFIYPTFYMNQLVEVSSLWKNNS